MEKYTKPFYLFVIGALIVLILSSIMGFETIMIPSAFIVFVGILTDYIERKKK